MKLQESFLATSHAPYTPFVLPSRRRELLQPQATSTSPGEPLAVSLRDYSQQQRELLQALQIFVDQGKAQHRDIQDGWAHIMVSAENVMRDLRALTDKNAEAAQPRVDPSRQELEELLASSRAEQERFKLASESAERLRSHAVQLLLKERREMEEKIAAAGLAQEAAEQEATAAELALKEVLEEVFRTTVGVEGAEDGGVVNRNEERTLGGSLVGDVSSAEPAGDDDAAPRDGAIPPLARKRSLDLVNDSEEKPCKILRRSNSPFDIDPTCILQ